MSTSVVSVLLLNGRRQKVKCSPNTTVLQIIEEVCQKHGLSAENYDVKHHNKVLDTSTTFRFSGLPNNAQLELSEATIVRLESDITLAITLENNERVMGNFKPKETLFNILSNMCPDKLNSYKNPVVIYTRTEIYGEALKKTTLKGLGLSSGRAMLRLIDRAPEELHSQAHVSAPLLPRPVEEKPFRRILKTEEQPPAFSKFEIPTNNELKPQGATKKTVDFVQLAKEKRKIESSNAIPVEEQSKEKRKNYESHSLKSSSTEQDSMDVDESPPCDKTEEDFVFLGSRNAMLFSLETAQAVPSEDLPDDFFDLTIDDAKKILRDVKRKRMEIENTPMLTSALRNLEESKKQLRHLSKYKKAIIRIIFPDRTVLQGTFAPSDSIKEVAEFVREFLEDTQLDFYIYFTPPKEILPENARLIEIGCVPGALLHLGTNSENRKGLLRKDLQNKFTSNSVASLAASTMRRQGIREGLKEFYEEDIDPNSAPSTSKEVKDIRPAKYEDYEPRQVVKPADKLPKWFKPSK